MKRNQLTKKSHEPAATEKGRGINNCPTPPQQKVNELKTESSNLNKT